jgi:hypothetical protein
MNYYERSWSIVLLFLFILKYGLLFYLKLFFYIEKQKQIHTKKNPSYLHAYLVDVDME